MSDLSDFIRNASPERKAEVYGEVMDAVTCRQALTLIVAALADFEGMGDPPQSSNPKVNRLRHAYQVGRTALGDG